MYEMGNLQGNLFLILKSGSGKERKVAVSLHIIFEFISRKVFFLNGITVRN